MTTIKHNNITWINLISPSVKEINEVGEEYPIHPLVAEELTSLTMRSKVDIYPDNLYFVLHFPAINQAPGCEIDFVIGRDFLITVHYSESYALEKLAKNMSRKENLREQYFTNKASSLALKILKELYDSAMHQIDEIHIKTNKLESKIFDGDEKENLRKISLIKRDILDFQRSFYLHGNVLASFEQSFKQNNHEDFFEPEFKNYLNALIGEHAQIKNLIQNNKETINTLHDTNESILSNKTNEVMKILTIMAFITFPLMLLSSVFGMNTISTPILGMKGDFWIITSAMFLATFTMFVVFKIKKWL